MTQHDIDMTSNLTRQNGDMTRQNTDMTRQDTDMTLPGSALRSVTVEEAARSLGVSVDAVRKRIERGTLKSEKVRGTRYVFLDASVSRSQDDMTRQDTERTHQDRGQDQRPDGAWTHQDSDTTALVASMQAQIDLLKQELKDRKEEARRKDAILLTMSQRIPELGAPTETRETPTTPSEDAPPPKPKQEQPSWWKRFFG